MTVRIPPSLQEEHHALHDQLGVLAREPGAIGDAARELARRLHPHFVREEEIALPPLGLLASLAAGEIGDDIAAVLPLTDALEREIDAMVREHAGIGEALSHLRERAEAAGRADAAAFADALALHARTEEEVLYPAARLVGREVARLLRRPARSA